jgi:hypothetical protein
MLKVEFLFMTRKMGNFASLNNESSFYSFVKPYGIYNYQFI